MTLKSLIRNSLIGLLAVFIVYVIFYMELDIPLMYFLYTPFQGTPIAQVCHLISMTFSPAAWLGVGILALAYAGMQIKNKKDCPAFALYWGADIVVAFALTALLKFTLARYRPIELINHNLYGFHFFSMQHNLNSTPSGHVALGFAALVGLGRRLKKQWIMALLVALAVVIALSKLIIADHYISDVIFGAYVGITSIYWTDYLLDHCKKCPRSA